MTWSPIHRGFVVGLMGLAVTGGGWASAGGATPPPSQANRPATPALPPPGPGKAQAWTGEQGEVWSTVLDLWRLSSALDLDAWFSKVSEDYRGWSITEEAPRGKPEWRAQAQARFSAPRRVHYQLVPRAIDVHGDMAIAYYHYAAVARSADGALSTSVGQWTDVFRREGSSWMLLADAGGETRASPELLVSTEWLARRVGGTELVVLQVESQEERYSDGHIPGALFLPYDRIVWDGPNEEGAEMLAYDEIQATLETLGIGNDQHVVVYGSHPLIAARLWLTLDVLGVGARVSLLDGGLPAWVEEGRPLSTRAAEAPVPTSLTLRPRAEIIVDAAWVLANLEDPGVALVDARFEEEYTGEGQDSERVGHLPGAGSAPWVDLVQSREVFRLRPVEELAAVFSRAGADPGETVVPYCIIGLRASLDYFVSRLLGFETRFYDGSWRDWTGRGLPLVEGSGAG